MEAANVLIEASAGTGKTQALARRLIELLRAGVRPQDIVALTFSRAAAGEIFERFVSLLAADAADDPSAAALLRSVISTQHLSQIGTLDSFLMRMLRSFPLELGLSGEIEMMDEWQAAAERAKIAFSILRRTDAASKRRFADAFSLAMNREDVRSFADSFRDFAKEWHGRVAAMPDRRSWGDPEAIWGRTPAAATVGARELAAAADALEKFPLGDAWMQFAAWVRNFRGRFGTLKGIAKKLVDGDGVFEGDAIEFTFARKKYPLTREQTLAVRDALLCVHGYVVRMKLELARGIWTLMSSFEEEYSRKVRKAGRLVFSDVPRLVASLPPAARLALEYRMDCRIGAWALDEFQDTSREQWAALSNLVDEAKQSGGEKPVFIVGDRKQAIYGWRDGDVGIFERERDSGAYGTEELSRTYRSGPAVVEAVNRVFARGRIFTEFPAWKCPEHKSARPGMDGFVRVMDAPGRAKEDFVEPVFTALKAALGEKEGDPRRRGVSAAVLVRGNALGALLADRLKRLGLEGVVWEGDSSVLDTPALSGFLDLFRIADHPGDAVSWRHFLMTPLAAAMYPDGIPEASAVSQEMSRAFAVRGVCRVLRELRAKLPPDPAQAWSAFTEERFVDMLRSAADFELTLSAGTRISDFPEFLAARKKRTVAEDGKIKVMTIHRSKGLGFDYVVLPLYERDALAADPSGPLVGDGWILPDPGSRSAEAVGGLSAASALRRDRAEQEALCTYYVAMTRAKKGMTIVAHPASQTLRFSDLVRSADLGDLANPGFAGFAAAAGAEAKGGPEKGVEAVAAAPPERPARRPRSRVRRRMPSLIPADGVSAASLFAKDARRRAAMERGTAAHAEYEKTEWIGAAEAKNAFERALVRPEGFVALWRERPFEAFDGRQWVSGRIDRAVFFVRDGLLCAEVQDFKTNRPLRGEGAEEFAERMKAAYAGQMAAYRSAVSSLAGIPPERVSATLLLAAAGAAAPIDFVERFSV